MKYIDDSFVEDGDITSLDVDSIFTLPLPILRTNLNSQALLKYFQILESFLNLFIKEYNLNSRSLQYGALEDWSICFDYGKRFAEISLLVLPYHAYYGSRVYFKERRRNFVLCFMITDLLNQTIVPQIVEYNSSMHHHVKGGNNSREVVVADASEEAAYLYDVARMMPNFPAVMGSNASTDLDDATFDPNSSMFSLGTSRTNVHEALDFCLKGTADGLYDSLLNFCLYGSSVNDEDMVGTEVTLEQYAMKRDELLAMARVNLNEDPAFQSIASFLDRQGTLENSRKVIAAKALRTRTERKEKPYQDYLSNHANTSQHNEKTVKARTRTSNSLRSYSSRSVFTGLSTLTKDSHSTSLSKEQSVHLSIEFLLQFYAEDFEELIKNDMVQIFYLGTYQGKSKFSNNADSTNGCTVIAPLIAAVHLESDVVPGISDAAIESVIDDEAPQVLRTLRLKLGLDSDAFIIPSDANDFLVEQSILTEAQFVGVCGGNVLNDGHIKTFLKMIKEGTNAEENKKTAATFFFHEHVVSIIKLVFPDTGKCWYDLIDSLPYENDKESESCRSYNEVGEEICHEKVDEPIDSALRIRCKSIDGLEAALKWYCVAKFLDEDIEYIDKHKWDELRCFVDPRVFQAFIWTAAP